MTLFALIKGNTTFKDIFFWMTYNENSEILKEITDNNALEKVFREFFFPFTAQENVAIDGKWLRGSAPQEYFLVSLTAY